MSESTQYTTFADLYQGLLRRLRISTGVTATDTQAKHYINVALQDIHLGFDYKLPWCERRGTIQTRTPYTTGTVSIAVGSVSLTGTGTLWNTVDSYGLKNARQLGMIRFAGSSDTYSVVAVSSDTSITITPPYAGTNDLTDAEYVYFENDYTLDSTFLRPVDFQTFSPESNITLLPRNEFRRRFPSINVTGRPRYACLVDSIYSYTTAIPYRRVLFYPYPDKVYTIHYTFITSIVATDSTGANSLTGMSADTDVPTMPLRYRHAIIFHALAHWYRDRKDDARAQAAAAEYTDIMTRIVGDHDIATHTMFRLQPSHPYGRYAARPYSYRGGRKGYDINNAFDEMKF